jgi:hypothetical protein
MKTFSQISGASRLTQALCIGACLFLGLTTLSYAGLVGLGRWQLDEYADFYRMRSGLPYVLERLKWSPRPISEPIYYAYGWIVNHVHSPLIVPFLGIFWAIFLLAGLFTFWQRFRQDRSFCRWEYLLIPLTLMDLFLAGGRISEVFYWPAGTVAYLPTLAATLLLFLQIIEGRLATSRGRMVGAICLIVAAGSSEAGATFVLCYCLLRIGGWCLTTLRRREPSRQNASLAWLTIPAILAAVVLFAVRVYRFNTRELPVFKQSSAMGHPLRSLMASLEEMVIEFIGRGMLAGVAHKYPHPGTWFHLGPRFLLEMVIDSRLPMEILLAVGVALWWSRFSKPSKEVAWQIIELAAAFLLTSIFIIAAAELHFGTPCCERHEVLRESWMVMTITGVAIASSVWARESQMRRRVKYSLLAPLFLCAAVISLGIRSQLIHSYRAYEPVRKAMEQNFKSGFQTEDEQMTFRVVPGEGIISEEPIPLGTFINRHGDITEFDLSMYPYYLMDFFQKQKIVIQPLRVNVTGEVSAAARLCRCDRVEIAGSFPGH